jgi:CBS domain containing-hemolysin-like protein
MYSAPFVIVEILLYPKVRLLNGGILFQILGRVAQDDLTSLQDITAVTFTIADSDGRRIKRLKIERVPDPVEASLFED